MFEIILATDILNGIGKNNEIPWKCSKELSIFKKKTQNSILIMGRKTIENLPLLQNRTIYCLTRNKNINKYKFKNDVTVFLNIDNCIKIAKKQNKKIFIAGGAEIYKYFFLHFKNYISKIHLSILKDSYNCDTFFNIDTKDFVISYEKDYKDFTHYEFEKTNFGEKQYLDLLRNINKNGNYRTCRNGETKSLFNNHLKFDLRNGFPLLTTKKMFIRGIIEELLFFIRGNTDSMVLQNKKINIWKGNTTKQFLQSRNLDYKEGEMGPMYGYQWRNFNSTFSLDNNKNIICHKNGVDQLKNVIHLIKNDPYSRRILLTDYNPSQSNLGVLYPCHSIIIQFYVIDNYLDMFCYNRSQDTVLGTPFNIASSSLLLILISKITNLTPRFLNMTLGDTHIYKQHFDKINIQTIRTPYKFPTLEILKDIKNLEDIEKLSFSDFKLNNYKCHDKIICKMIP